MFQAESIFQRTQSGRDEIYHKSRGLTQSERRVLIMLDGVTACAELLREMSTLSKARIERAISTLLQRDLVYEVLMPLAGQQAEQIEEAVLERFLQQDPMDPATIISLDPEEEFGDIEDLFKQALPEIKAAISNRRQTNFTAEVVFPNVHSAPSQKKAAPLPPIEPAYGKAKQPADNTRGPGLTISAAWQIPQQQLPRMSAALRFCKGEVTGRPHWGYWTISAGLCLMGSSLLTRILA